VLRATARVKIEDHAFLNTFIRLFDAFDMAMVSLGMMVVIEDGRCPFAGPNGR
jgi:hypothetical protein